MKNINNFASLFNPYNKGLCPNSKNIRENYTKNIFQRLDHSFKCVIFLTNQDSIDISYLMLQKSFDGFPKYTYWFELTEKYKWVRNHTEMGEIDITIEDLNFLKLKFPSILKKLSVHEKY